MCTTVLKLRTAMESGSDVMKRDQRCMVDTGTGTENLIRTKGGRTR